MPDTNPLSALFSNLADLPKKPETFLNDEGKLSITRMLFPGYRSGKMEEAAQAQKLREAQATVQSAQLIKSVSDLFGGAATDTEQAGSRRALEAAGVDSAMLAPLARGATETRKKGRQAGVASGLAPEVARIADIDSAQAAGHTALQGAETRRTQSQQGGIQMGLIGARNKARLSEIGAKGGEDRGTERVRGKEDRLTARTKGMVDSDVEYSKWLYDRAREEQAQTGDMEQFGAREKIAKIGAKGRIKSARITQRGGLLREEEKGAQARGTALLKGDVQQDVDANKIGLDLGADLERIGVEFDRRAESEEQKAANKSDLASFENELVMLRDRANAGDREALERLRAVNRASVENRNNDVAQGIAAMQAASRERVAGIGLRRTRLGGREDRKTAETKAGLQQVVDANRIGLALDKDLQTIGADLDADSVRESQRAANGLDLQRFKNEMGMMRDRANAGDATALKELDIMGRMAAQTQGMKGRRRLEKLKSTLEKTGAVRDETNAVAFLSDFAQQGGQEELKGLKEKKAFRAALQQGGQAAVDMAQTLIQSGRGAGVQITVPPAGQLTDLKNSGDMVNNLARMRTYLDTPELFTTAAALQESAEGLLARVGGTVSPLTKARTALKTDASNGIDMLLRSRTGAAAPMTEQENFRIMFPNEDDSLPVYKAKLEVIEDFAKKKLAADSEIWELMASGRANEVPEVYKRLGDDATLMPIANQRMKAIEDAYADDVITPEDEAALAALGIKPVAK